MVRTIPDITEFVREANVECHIMVVPVHDGLPIFVVEDDIAVQDSLRALLESANLRVESFATGFAFLDAIGDRRRGCVVLDIDLPDIDGLEILHRLESAGIDIPVILISGRLDRAMRNRVCDKKTVALLEKPMRDDLLLEAIGKALDRNGQN